MSLWRLIATNLRRHRVRTAIGAAGVALGTATMLCVVAILGGAVRMFERILSSDAELVVFERNVSDLFFSNVPSPVTDGLTALPAVESADPVLFAIISAPERPVITCFGVLAANPRLRNATWLAGSPESFHPGAPVVVVGERAAEFLQAELGKPLPLGGEDYEVAGIIRTENGFEDGGVFMPLETCQRAFHKEEKVSVITVALADGHETGEVVAWIDAEHPELTALENEEFSNSYSQFKIIRTTAWVVGGCAFLLGGLSVTNTMILSVFTRIRELAILRVCGFSRGQVARLIFGESLLVAALGVLAGWLLSATALRLLKALPFLQGYLDPTIGWTELAVASSLAACTALIGALYPALHAARLLPARALRYE